MKDNNCPYPLDTLRTKLKTELLGVRNSIKKRTELQLKNMNIILQFTKKYFCFLRIYEMNRVTNQPAEMINLTQKSNDVQSRVDTP